MYIPPSLKLPIRTVGFAPTLEKERKRQNLPSPLKNKSLTGIILPDTFLLVDDKTEYDKTSQGTTKCLLAVSVRMLLLTGMIRNTWLTALMKQIMILRLTFLTLASFSFSNASLILSALACASLSSWKNTRYLSEASNLCLLEKSCFLLFISRT